jgi:dTDP-glucose 4,6-dehydratase
LNGENKGFITLLSLNTESAMTNFEKKCYFVTGGAGFIASTYVADRISEGHEVVVYDALTYAGHRENVEWIDNVDDRLHMVVGNICDGETANGLFKKYQVDYVVNFAAESHVDNSIASPGEFINTNINGVYAMLEAARGYYNELSGAKKDGFRFIQVSTDEVYGTLGAEGYFTEETSMKPNSPYSASKAAGDHLARAWCETYGLPTIVTNCTNNYGPRQFPEKLIPFMIGRALSGGVMGIYGDGKNIRDWIHVEDHCAGVQLALQKGKVGETYCFGGRAEKNNNQMVNIICELLDEKRPRADGKSYKEQIEYVVDRAGHDFRYAIDDSKAESELGFARKYTYEQGMSATVDWYLDNQAWADAVTSETKAA